MALQNEFSSATASFPVAPDRERTTILSVKRALDITLALFGLCVMVLAAPVVALINLRHNPGPLFFRQQRMGKDCKPFTLIKFRSMRPACDLKRGPNDPLEKDRITPFGGFLRRSRIDELPQLWNVLRGEMSLIGPRPDAFHHATHFVKAVPGYRERHVVRPGITGLAQTKLGYAEGVEATRRKVEVDLEYIDSLSIETELRLLWRTAVVVVSGFGAR